MPEPRAPIRGESSEGPPAWASTITGRVDVTALLRDGHRRTVRVRLPDDYEWTDHDYPVIYMFDGHSLFDRATTTFGTEWGIDETLSGLEAAGSIDGVVVVGVDAPQGPVARYAEYTAWDWVLPTDAGPVPVRASGHTTADFLVGTVVPYVQATYRVARDRARVGLAGSSMGGYMTLYVGARHPEVFGRLLAFSPVVLEDPMRGDLLRAFLRERGFAPDTWVYMDMGDHEQLRYVDIPAELVADLDRTLAAVAGSSRPPARVVGRVIRGGAHDESAWGGRFAPAVLWAFAGDPDPA